jgi:hypothetical protein
MTGTTGHVFPFSLCPILSKSGGYGPTFEVFLFFGVCVKMRAFKTQNLVYPCITYPLFDAPPAPRLAASHSDENSSDSSLSAEGSHREELPQISEMIVQVVASSPRLEVREIVLRYRPSTVELADYLPEIWQHLRSWMQEQANKHVYNDGSKHDSFGSLTVRWPFEGLVFEAECAVVDDIEEDDEELRVCLHMTGFTQLYHTWKGLCPTLG